MNDLDARERGVSHGDLVKVWNDRGAVICAPTSRPGPVERKSFGTERRIPDIGSPASGRDWRLHEH
jgi:hypothetical protein